MKDAVSTYETAISSGDASAVSDASLSIKPEFRDPEYMRLAMVNGGSPVEHVSYIDVLCSTLFNSVAFCLCTAKCQSTLCLEVNIKFSIHMVLFSVLTNPKNKKCCYNDKPVT
jgi:hypothetical protein